VRALKDRRYFEAAFFGFRDRTNQHMATDVADLEPETREGFTRGPGLLDSTKIVGGSIIGTGFFAQCAGIPLRAAPV
jgi:hypothetical protein